MMYARYIREKDCLAPGMDLDVVERVELPPIIIVE